MTFGLAKRFLSGSLRFALEASVSPNMKHGDVPLLQNPADQPPAVAVRGVLLAADQGDAAGTHFVEKAVDTMLKSGRLGHAIVEHVSLPVVERFTFRPAPDHISEEHVADALGLQIAIDHILVEM